MVCRSPLTHFAVVNVPRNSMHPEQRQTSVPSHGCRRRQAGTATRPAAGASGAGAAPLPAGAASSAAPTARSTTARRATAAGTTHSAWGDAAAAAAAARRSLGCWHSRCGHWYCAQLGWLKMFLTKGKKEGGRVCGEGKRTNPSCSSFEALMARYATSLCSSRLSVIA